MSATATAPVGRASRRPVLTGLPSIQVVPTPAPARGLFFTIVTCVALFVGALFTVFALNTAMVEGAYEIRHMQIELNSLAATGESLAEEVANKSTAVALTESAEELGLVPATDVRHIDLESGALTGGLAEPGE